MDGEAISLAFASCSVDIIPKYGLRLKVYQAIKREIKASTACSSASLVIVNANFQIQYPAIMFFTCRM